MTIRPVVATLAPALADAAAEALADALGDTSTEAAGDGVATGEAEAAGAVEAAGVAPHAAATRAMAATPSRRARTLSEEVMTVKGPQCRPERSMGSMPRGTLPATVLPVHAPMVPPRTDGPQPADRPVAEPDPPDEELHRHRPELIRIDGQAVAGRGRGRFVGV